MSARDSLPRLHEEIVACRACPRLVAWRETVARDKVRRFRDLDYWGKPVPGFGDPKARLVIVGLAPGAHGANRTGRAFTGDRSGDFLYAALHRAGFASQPTSVDRDDDLRLRDAFILMPVRCAPPENAPRPDEVQRCSSFFTRELELLSQRKVLLALGQLAWNASRAYGRAVERAAFAHGAELALSGGLTLLGSYHVSQQNTQTGRLTPAMFDAVLERARVFIGTSVR